MSQIHSSSTNSPIEAFNSYSALPDDAKAEVMKFSSLKQLDAGLAKSDKTSNRVALDLVKTLALSITQMVDTIPKQHQESVFSCIDIVTFESACIAQLIKVELLRHRFADSKSSRRFC